MALTITNLSDHAKAQVKALVKEAMAEYEKEMEARCIAEAEAKAEVDTEALQRASQKIPLNPQQITAREQIARYQENLTALSIARHDLMKKAMSAASTLMAALAEESRLEGAIAGLIPIAFPPGPFPPGPVVKV